MQSRWNLSRLNLGITDVYNERSADFTAILKLFAWLEIFWLEIKTGGEERHPKARQLKISED